MSTEVYETLIACWDMYVNLLKGTVLSRCVESLFAFTRELYPWGNFPGNVQNQSINQA